MRLVVPLVLIFSVFTLVNLLPQEAFANTSASHPFILEWGESGLMKAGYFSFPQNLASDDFGNIYVTDLGNMRVQKFDNDGTFLNAWGSSGSGSGQFRSPMGIEVFEGSVFVVDSQLNRIQKFDLDGNFVTKWGEQGSGAGQFLLPNGIAVGNNGTIYVVDTGNQRIQKFTQDGEYISEFGASGMEDGKFLSPKGIAIDKEENIYVTDPGKNKIFKFNSDGLYLNSFGPNAGGISIKPEGLVIDPVGNIYATDTNYNRILQISQEGATLTIWGSMGIMNGQFKTPKDIEVDAFGQVFVVDSNGHRIQKFGSPYVTEIPEEEPSTSESQTTQETQSLPKVEPVPGDLTKPVITTPNDLFIEATSGLTPVSVGQAMATDESGIQSLTNNAPAKFPLGVTTIIWTAIDGAGNMAIATQTISVVDTIPPLITPVPDVTVEAQTPGENPVTLTNPETLDVVGVISVTNDAPTVFPLGETIITWTAIDVAGNLATTTQKVNVVDTTKPT
ncbi:MAG: putative Peptidylamidoglycolate lyase, partial [Nitrosopumilales archaeon]